MKLGSLDYDPVKGEGTVKWQKGAVDFDHPNVMLMDSLKDWIFVLKDAYDHLHAVTFPTEDN